MRRRGEDRLLEQVFPVTREFPHPDDLRLDGGAPAALPGEHHLVALANRGGAAEFQRRQVERPERLHQPEPGLLVVAEDGAGHGAAAVVGDPGSRGLSSDERRVGEEGGSTGGAWWWLL